MLAMRKALFDMIKPVNNVCSAGSLISLELIELSVYETTLKDARGRLKLRIGLGLFVEFSDE